MQQGVRLLEAGFSLAGSPLVMEQLLRSCALPAAEQRVRLLHTSNSEVLSKRKIERQGFRRKPDTCFFKSGVKEVKGLSTSEQRSGSERSGDP